MEHRAHLLVELSVRASRPEYRESLTELLKQVRENQRVTRIEVYEAFLQLYLFAGFPASLEAMKALSRAWPADDGIERHQFVSSEYTAFFHRGQELYQRIYGKNAETVKREMLRLSPELAVWAVTEGYGKTLARTELDVVTRELCVVAILTQLNWQRQLFSHILGALNAGATREAIAEAIHIGSLGDAEAEARGLQLLSKA
jgi:4-carboxymuconolactone decarboxylase